MLVLTGTDGDAVTETDKAQAGIKTERLMRFLTAVLAAKASLLAVQWLKVITVLKLKPGDLLPVAVLCTCFLIVD